MIVDGYMVLPCAADNAYLGFSFGDLGMILLDLR